MAPFRTVWCIALVTVASCAQSPEASTQRPTLPDSVTPVAPPVALPPADLLPDSVGIALVLVSTTDGRTATFAPLAFIQADQLLDLPLAASSDAGLQRYRAAYAPSGRLYRLIEAGRPVGALVATGMREYGCSGAEGIGIIEPALLGAWSGLATTDTSPTAPWHRRDFTSDEREAMIALARPALLDLDASPGGAASAELRRGYSYVPQDGPPVYAAAYRHHEPGPDGSSETLSVLLFAQRTPTGLTSTYVWSHRGAEESRQVRDLVDAVDLNHDGQLEFVTSLSYYESGQFQIMDREGNVWFTGAFSGC